MKKVAIYLLIILVLCFILPVIFTKKFDVVETMASILKENLEQQEKKVDEVKVVDYDYSKYKTVKLLHSNTGEIEEVNLDEYCVMLYQQKCQ